LKNLKEKSEEMIVDRRGNRIQPIEQNNYTVNDTNTIRRNLNRVKSAKDLITKRNKSRINLNSKQMQRKDFITSQNNITNPNYLSCNKNSNTSNYKRPIISAQNKKRNKNSGGTSCNLSKSTNGISKCINLKKIKAELNRHNCMLFILFELDLYPWNYYSPSKKEILNCMINSKYKDPDFSSSRYENSLGKNLSLSSNFNLSDYPAENSNNKLFISSEDFYNNIPNFKNKNYDKYLVNMNINSTKSEDRKLKEENKNFINEKVKNLINRIEEKFLKKNENNFVKNKYKEVISEHK
jgi:hypothetical protein